MSTQDYKKEESAIRDDYSDESTNSSEEDLENLRLIQPEKPKLGPVDQYIQLLKKYSSKAKKQLAERGWIEMMFGSSADSQKEAAMRITSTFVIVYAAQTLV